MPAGPLDQPDLTFPEVLRNNERSYRDQPAVRHGERTLTWAEFGKQSNRAANTLVDRGLMKGDRVAVLMRNSIETFLLIWGIIKAGGVVTPLSYMAAAESLPGIINNADPRFLFVDEESHRAVEAVRGELRLKPDAFVGIGVADETWRDGMEFFDSERDDPPDVMIAAHDSMTLVYSSGTTGVPKGIEHTHGARNFYPLGYSTPCEIDRYTISVNSTPLYTNAAWVTMGPTMFWGGTVVLTEEPGTQALLRTIELQRVTHAFLVPTQLVRILNQPDLADYDLTSLRVIVTGAAPMTKEILHGVAEQLPQSRLVESWGFAEGVCTVAIPEDRRDGRDLTVGKPHYGGDVRVINEDGTEAPAGDTGELVGWGAGMMRGYFRDPPRTEAIVWRSPEGRTYLRSGDLGHIDEQGYVFVSGRLKDMIDSGGFNVYPSDIEAIFIQHPAVRECAAIGIPHPEWGETPLLLAVIEDDARITASELMEWGNARLGKHQRVSGVEFRSEFPHVLYDKVLKRELRDPYWIGHERKI